MDRRVMAVNTTYNPGNVEAFDNKAVMFNAKGISSDVSAGTTANIDLKITGDHLLTGAILLTNNSNFGDYISFQVVDVDNIMGLGVNMVLKQFVTNWYMLSDQQKQIDFSINYPAKLIDGLYIRLVYTSTSQDVSPKVSINYMLHTVLE